MRLLSPPTARSAEITAPILSADEIATRVRLSTLPASLPDWDASACALSHVRRLNALMQMQNTFAGIKPYCAVCNPITQTMRLLTQETASPLHILLPTRIVATTVRKQDK